MMVNIKIRRPIDEVLNDHGIAGPERIFYRNFTKQLIELITKGIATVRARGISEKYLSDFLKSVEKRGYDTSQLRILRFVSKRRKEVLCTIWRHVETYEELKKFYEAICGLDPEVMDAILDKLVKIGELHLI